MACFTSMVCSMGLFKSLLGEILLKHCCFEIYLGAKSNFIPVISTYCRSISIPVRVISIFPCVGALLWKKYQVGYWTAYSGGENRSRAATGLLCMLVIRWPGQISNISGLVRVFYIWGSQLFVVRDPFNSKIHCLDPLMCSHEHYLNGFINFWDTENIELFFIIIPEHSTDSLALSWHYLQATRFCVIEVKPI